ncbi:hypothetical protein ACU4GD_12045 [Cupriavidus basilensis]
MKEDYPFTAEGYVLAGSTMLTLKSDVQRGSGIASSRSSQPMNTKTSPR